ncbi:WXG100 family type VII secretion target [Micromonospora sp. NPDC023814]|uniref:WXG100 family type VII secretion target n=1 Tax=Micromonospora sp. NPDC023814 TaxID=3154596 RepID=UPI0033FB2D18
MTGVSPVLVGHTVNLSGALSWLLSRYATVLAEYRRQMTGDPAGLRAVAHSYLAIADQAAGVSGELVRRRTGLSAQWHGSAYDAFGAAAGRVATGLDGTEARLRRHAAALERAAGGLEAAASTADTVIARFRANAQLLVAAAGAVPSSQVSVLLGHARNIGEQALGAMRGVWDRLGVVLAQVATELGGSHPVGAAGPAAAAGADGRLAGEKVRAALAGDASPAQFRQSMAQLAVITDRVRAGQPPSAADKAFLTSFYGTLGDRVFDLPGYVNATEHRYQTSLFGIFGETAPGFAPADRQEMLRTVGNGILTLSQDPADLPAAVRDLVHTPAATETNIGTNSFGFTHEVPATPGRAPLTGVLGETVYTYRLDVPRYAQWEALSQLTGAADRDLVAGADYSAAVTRRVGEMADVTQRLDDLSRHSPDQPGYYVSTDDAVLWDKPRVDATMTTLLDVSTRNHVADAALASDGETLRRLAGFGWADDGSTAGRVVDWIGAGTADPAEHDLARGAYVNLTQTMTDPASYPQTLAAMRENPHFAEAIARATVPNLDLYAQPLDGLDTDPAAQRLGSTDARHMLMLGQVTQDGRDEISAAADLYQEYLLRQADAGTIPMEQAGRYAGNVDGLTNAAAANAIWYANVQDAEQATRTAQEAYARQVAIANAVKDVVGFGVGKLPEVGEFAGFAFGQAADVVTGALQAPAPVHPQSVPTDVFHHPQFTGNGTVYTAAGDLASFELRNGGSAPTVPVGALHGAAAEEAVRWARADPGRADYMDAYTTAAQYVYLANLATHTRESIQYDVQGRRP